MKLSHLLSTSLLVATAWAVSDMRWVFFAKLEGTFVPLSAKTLDGLNDIMSIFSYGDPSAVPAEFSLTEYNYAYGPNQEMIGFFKPFFAFGYNVEPMPLQRDSHNKIVNGRFHSCSVNTSSVVHKIFYDLRLPIRGNCSEVDIYFLPYDKSSGTQLKTWTESSKGIEEQGLNNIPKGEDPTTELKTGAPAVMHSSPTQEETEITFEDQQSSEVPQQRDTKSVKETKLSKSPSVAQNLPYVFWAYFGGVYTFLSGRVLSHYGNDFSVMNCVMFDGDPIEFTMEGDYALSMNTSTDGYFGIKDKIVVFGPKIPPMKLSLNKDRKVLNTNFYFCRDDDYKQVIGVTMINKDCFEIEIYLFQKKISGNVITDLNKPIDTNGIEREEEIGADDDISEENYDSEEYWDSEDESFDSQPQDENDDDFDKPNSGTYYNRYSQNPSDEDTPDSKFEFVSLDDSAPRAELM